MADWFRNKVWSEAIEACFEDKLSRARDKSQYLKIQGYELLDGDPRVAARLLSRCAEIDDHWKADALLYLGQARLRQGDAVGAIEALDGAIEQERRVPWARTGARSDRALIISFFGMTTRYDDVLPYLADANIDLTKALVEDLAAEAMILAEVGDRARARLLAEEALRWIEGLANDEASPMGRVADAQTGISLVTLISRLKTIAI